MAGSSSESTCIDVGRCQPDRLHGQVVEAVR